MSRLRSICVTHDGQTLSLLQWAQRLAVTMADPPTARHLLIRYDFKWPPARMLTTPLHWRSRRPLGAGERPRKPPVRFADAVARYLATQEKRHAE